MDLTSLAKSHWKKKLLSLLNLNMLFKAKYPQNHHLINPTQVHPELRKGTMTNNHNNKEKTRFDSNQMVQSGSGRERKFVYVDDCFFQDG